MARFLNFPELSGGEARESMVHMEVFSLSPEGGQGGQHGKAEGGAGGDGGGGGREGHLGQPNPVLLHRPRLLRRARQHLEVPLPLPEERWR